MCRSKSTSRDRQAIQNISAGQLRTFRRNVGLTQSELAARINRTGEAIANIERGKSQPTLETLFTIADTRELSLRDFFPCGGFDDSIIQNKLKTKAKAMALLRGLTDSQLTAALVQIKALREL